TVVVSDVEAGLRLRHALGVTLVTKDGTVLHADGRISGGSGEELAQGMLETKREIRALGEEVVRKDAHASECLARHQHLRERIAEIQGFLERARQKAHDDELALVHAERDLHAAEAKVESAQRRMETVATELAELVAALDAASAERELAARVLDEARATLASKSLELEGSEAQAASWRAQVDGQREVVMDKRVRVAGVRERLTAARGTVTRLEKSHDELGARAARLDEELCAGAAEAGTTAALLVRHREELGLALDAARDAEKRLSEARTVFDAFRASLSEKDALLKDLRSQAETAREELGVHEMALREKELALSHLVESVAEKFRGLRLDRIIGDYHLRPPPDDESRARIGELTNLIDRMGSVNLDAMREHEEAEKRYAFYTEQKADLDRALADLERAIQQMNRESKRLFQDTFEAVNERFQEIFPKMFRGGRAALRLTNPEDMLETGIDILAQPPGKKLSSIELMSGGEKALTAVSLIFAIFQIKPSPFCILDEVDAPLDEANVARYNEMIRGMTDRSQFILITHIKRTMQMVDVLHGVTMQELGVSRLVSVRVDGAMSGEAGVKKTDKKTGGGEAAVA
ncbi:MAG: chromosome segregation protein SMC, partial [Myxococcales bacterium]|nr:chromosome segregation protein SMC [Myxococcales bacterium]